MNAKRVITNFISFLLLVMTLFIFFFLVLLYSMMSSTYDGLYQDVSALMKNQFDIDEYTIMDSKIYDFLFDPAGRWWLELPEGFDIQKLRTNREFWVNSDLYPDERISSEQIAARVQDMYGVEVHGFEAFFAEDPNLGMNICTYSSGCNLVIYAKDGDKNFFVSFFTM